MKKIYLLLFLLLMTVAKINAAEPTIVQYKSSNRCYINISEALTDAQVATLKDEIESKGYTSVDFGTKNGYALTPTDLQMIFGTTNGLLQTTNAIKVLSLKDVTLTEDAADQYGQQIGYLPALEELTTPKSCKGPNMVSPTPEHKTIKKLIIPKLGANDTSDKALATVGQWQGYMALESIDLNTSIAPSGIEDNAFYRCSNLKTVKIMSTNITSIGENAFRDCVSMQKITLPYGLKTIGTAAFRNCFLKNINLPQTVETIGADAFRGNPNVRTIKIPASVQSIGSYAFGEMPELDNVYVFGENTKAAANAFDKDVIGERFTYTRSTLTERQQVQNATLEEANHTGWLRSDYQKLSSWTVNPSDGSVTLQYTTAPRNPAQLHILNTETAKKNYLNPFLRFLNGGYQVGDSLWTVEKLINVYKFVAEHKGEKSSDGNAGWSALKPYNPSNATDNLSTYGLCDAVWATISSYDENSDGSITKAEVANKTWTDANLTNYDFDDPKDDIITKESFKTQYWDATLQSYDTDNDGSITKTDEGNKKWTTTPLSDLAKDSNNDITKESLGASTWNAFRSVVTNNVIAQALITDAQWNEISTYDTDPAASGETPAGDGFITDTEYKDGAWRTFSATWTDCFEDNDSITKEQVEANNKEWSNISKYKSGEYDYITADSYQQVVWEEAANLYSTPFVKTSDLTGDLASYTSYDTNNDNVITEQEVLDKAWADATDATNGSLKDYSAYTSDGNLTKSEVEAKTWDDLSSALSSYNNYSQGTITKESVANAHWRTISAYDYNSDGTITKAEAGEYAWNTKLPYKDYALKVYDYDGDGTITKTTICDKISSFSSFDTDRNGTITKSEVSTAAGGWEAVGVFDYDNNGEIGDNDAVTYINSLLSACSFSGMENSMRSYMKGIYFDGESDYKAIVGDNNRPWVTFYDSESSDNIVTRLPYYAWENQFPAPVSDPINYATAKDQSTAKYAGWNQFILAFADAQTDQPETHIERWTGSKWYTICVPFSLSQHQVQETFGTQTEVVEFTKVIKDENGVTTFYFYKPAAELDESGSGGENNNTNYIKPYHPYMIHPGLTTAQVGMGGEHSEYRVILGELNTSGAGSPQDSWSQAQKAEKAITVNFYDYYEDDHYDNTETDGKTATRYTFYGRAEEGKAYKPNSVDPYSGYKEMSTIPVGSFFWAYTKSNGAETNDGSFYHNAGQAIAWPQYTAIIYLSKGKDYMDYNVSSNARNGGTIFDLEDAEYIYDYDVDTGVLKVSLPAQPKAADNRVYNLNGQYVGDSLDGLTKGIYIMNGKKYVVK